MPFASSTDTSRGVGLSRLHFRNSSGKVVVVYEKERGNGCHTVPPYSGLGSRLFRLITQFLGSRIQRFSHCLEPFLIGILDKRLG